MVDTLAYAKSLEEAGLDRRLAEAHAKALHDFALPDIATKGDLALLRTELKADLALLRTELKADIEAATHRALWQGVAAVGALNAIVFALLRWTGH